MKKLLTSLIAKRFETQDPRMPQHLQTDGVPFARMDSPVYRCCLQALCEAHPVRSFLEIGVKRGASLEVVLKHAPNLKRVVLCDFWTINDKKREELRIVEALIAEHAPPGVEVLFLDGSTLQTLKALTGSFDLIGVDGSHRRDVFRADLLRALELVAPDGHIVLDDLVLHEDHKIDDELMRLCRERSREMSIRFRDISHWPGGAIVARRGEHSSLRALVADCIASGATLESTTLQTVSDVEVVDALNFYREQQDWQAVDALLEVAFSLASPDVVTALRQILERQSLEIDNERIRNHLARTLTSPTARQEVLAVEALNGLQWSGPTRRVVVSAKHTLDSA